ncbi:hypothetical protein OAZ00_03905 [Acidimicrobiia bacterium]|nr:hypothetical protein [Acidimicrobiia bacterium]
MDWLELFVSMFLALATAFMSYGLIEGFSEMYAKVISGEFGNKDSLSNRVWRFIDYPFAIFHNIFFKKIPYSGFIWYLLWVVYLYFAEIGKLPSIF